MKLCASDWYDDSRLHKLWADPDTPDRERKRLLAHIIEDVTLIKMPAEGTTRSTSASRRQNPTLATMSQNLPRSR